MTQHPKIYVAGHRGMVGSAIVRHLLSNCHPAERIVTQTHADWTLKTKPQSALSLPPKSLTRLTRQPRRWKAFTPTTPIQPNSFIRTL